MVVGAVVLALICYGSGQVTSTYIITYSSSGLFQGTKDGASMGAAASATVSSSVASVALSSGVTLQYYSSPVSVSLSQLQAAVGLSTFSTNYTNIYQLAPNGVYRGVDPNNYPYVTYFVSAGPALYLICGPALDVGSDPFKCNGAGLGATFNFVAPSQQSSTSASASVTIGNGETFLNSVLAIAAIRAQAFQNYGQQVDQETTANNAALQNARVAIGFLYAFVFVAMFMLIVVMATWQSWCLPIYKKYNTALLIWFLIFTLIVWIVTIFGGAVGWVVILSLMGVYAIVLPIVWCGTLCHRRRRAGVYVDTPPNANKDEASASKRRSAASATSSLRAATSEGGEETSYSEQEEEDTSGDEEETGGTGKASSDVEAANESPTPADADDDDNDDTRDFQVASSDDSAGAVAMARDDSDEVDDDNKATAAAGKGTKSNPNAIWKGNKKQFDKCPWKLGRVQFWLLFAFGTAAFMSIIAIIIIFFAWQNQLYTCYDRGTEQTFTEFQPSTVAKGVWAIYAFPRLANLWLVNPLLVANTVFCGDHYNKILTSDDDKMKDIKVAYIDTYSIDMSIYARPSYLQYNSVNDWFSRTLAPGVRPIASANNDSIVVSGADSRLSVFQTVPSDQSVWLKDSDFTIAKLLGDDTQASFFTNGAMAIMRLAPADYHRTHSPISGTISYQHRIDSTIFSVAAVPMRAEDDAIFNTRVVTIIQSNTNTNLRVAFVAIGATCVGSIQMMKGVGDQVTKGENFSYFQFGGSTVAMVFPANTVKFDSDLVFASQHATEVFVHMGSQIGVVV